MANIVKNHFREYKKILIDLVGNGPMYEDTIDTIGKASFGKRWVGVLLVTKQKNCCRCGTVSRL